MSKRPPSGGAANFAGVLDGQIFLPDVYAARAGDRGDVRPVVDDDADAAGARAAEQSVATASKSVRGGGIVCRAVESAATPASASFSAKVERGLGSRIEEWNQGSRKGLGTTAASADYFVGCDGCRADRENACRISRR